MPNQADVALAILTLVLAFIAVVGQQLRCVLEGGQRLLLALWGRRAVVHAPWQEHIGVPGQSDPFRVADDWIEREQHQRAARAYGLARLRDFATRAAQE